MALGVNGVGEGCPCVVDYSLKEGGRTGILGEPMPMKE